VSALQCKISRQSVPGGGNTATKMAKKPLVGKELSCNVRTGPTPGFQPLGELRDRPGKSESKYNSKSALLFKRF